jgi:hypothetical protein
LFWGKRGVFSGKQEGLESVFLMPDEEVGEKGKEVEGMNE